MFKPEHHVFDWLENVRARPSMYIQNSSLEDLQTMVLGYYIALRIHGMIEPVPSMGIHFMTWITYRKKWSTSSGWAFAINQKYPEPEKALAAFFKLVDEFKQLVPTIKVTILLGPNHNPTGNRRVFGKDRKMEKPTRVDILQYAPSPLHFLRFHYDTRVEDDWILQTGAGGYATLLNAKEWVRDELQVDLHEWVSVS